MGRGRGRSIASGASSLPTRRDFLRIAGAATAGLAASLWLPRSAAGAALPGPVWRVIFVVAPGGVRWTATFDAQASRVRNPWGVMPWSLVGRGRAPEWGMSRMLLQKPPFSSETDWNARLYPGLVSDDPERYNVARPPLRHPSWGGALLPSFADIAEDVAVVRVTGDPDGPFDDYHGSASHTLYTGYSAGDTGLATVFQKAVLDQLGAGADAFYPLRAVAVSQAKLALGAGSYLSARPLFLTAPTHLPGRDSGRAQPDWARAVEAELDAAFTAAQPAAVRAQADTFVSDKSNYQYVSQLAHPALRFDGSPRGGTTALGTLVDGATPVTGEMLAEVFGLSSEVAPPGDILFDAVSAILSDPAPFWSIASDYLSYGVNGYHDAFGLNGALAVRLLQLGSPAVAFTVGDWDSHSFEVVDPNLGRSHPIQAVKLTRLLTGLDFALRRIADPLMPGRSLWDSTVVVVCSEFGRGGRDVGPNGFSTPNGQNGGGTEHDEWSAWPLLGGPIAAGGKLLAPAGAPYYHQNRVFSTLLSGMGIDADKNAYFPYSRFPPIEGLLRRGGS